MLNPVDIDLIRDRVLMDYEALFAQTDEQSLIRSEIVKIACEVALRVLDAYTEISD